MNSSQLCHCTGNKGVNLFSKRIGKLKLAPVLLPSVYHNLETGLRHLAYGEPRWRDPFRLVVRLCYFAKESFMSPLKHENIRQHLHAMSSKADGCAFALLELAFPRANKVNMNFNVFTNEFLS
jgi:hypothetical protein